MMRGIIFLTIFFLTSVSAISQNRTSGRSKPSASASATVTNQKVLLGEPFLLRLSATAPVGTKIAWFDKDTLPHFEIVQRSKLDSQVNGTELQLQQVITLISFDSGRWNIPSFTLGKARTKPVPIEVVFTSPFDPNQPYHEIRDIIDVQKPEDSKWIWILIVVLLLAVLFALFFPKRKKQPVAIPKLELRVDPYDRAYDRLKKLKAAGLEKTDHKLYFSELVDIFREYLHQKKNIQSFSKTTDDLAIQISKLNMEKEQYNKLVQVLRLSDGVKFARFRPSVEESREALHIIHQSILSIEDSHHVV